MALISREFLESRPIEIGKIKIGMRGKARSTSGGGTSYLPEKLDHFQVTTMEREDGDGPFIRDEAVHGVVGDKPLELRGWLMYPEVEENLHTEMTVYRGRRRQWTCDGVQRTLRDGREEPCQKESSCGCKPYARLQLQLAGQPQMGGYYVYRTHGWSSTNNLQTALEEIKREFKTLYKAPVRLIMQKTEDTYLDGDKERTGKSWKVGLVLDMSLADAQEYLAGEARKAIATREILQLEAGAVVADLDLADRENEGELADEFSPPRGVAASVHTQSRLDDAIDHMRGLPEPPVLDAELEDDEPEPEGGDATAETGSNVTTGESADGGETDAGSPDTPHPVAGFLKLAIEHGTVTADQRQRFEAVVAGDDAKDKDLCYDYLKGKLQVHGVIPPEAS